MAEPRASVLLRLPTALKERLREQAKRNDRTINGEIARIIRENVERNLSPHLETRQP